MADIIDVQNALVNLIATAIYPNGPSQPSAVNATPVRIYAGWPDAASLDADLAIGTCHISVFSRPEEKNTTRYPKDWQQVSTNTATLTATINGQAITIGGAMPTPFTAHNVMAMVNGKPYVYSVLNTDTLATIATALAVLIAADVPATSAAGAIVTCPNTARITAARIGVTGTAARELRRQERSFQITVWANTPVNRDLIGSTTDLALTSVEFMTLPDSFAARLIYQNSHVNDGLQKERLYRRDLQYSVEFATTQTEVETQITQEQFNTSIKTDAATQYGIVNTTYF